MKTIHAHTETTARMPGFVNISEQDDGRITVTVRTRGGKCRRPSPWTATSLRPCADVAAFLAPRKPPRPPARPKVKPWTCAASPMV